MSRGAVNTSDTLDAGDTDTPPRGPRADRRDLPPRGAPFYARAGLRG